MRYRKDTRFLPSARPSTEWVCPTKRRENQSRLEVGAIHVQTEVWKK